MDPKERNEKLERWLDDALAGYSKAKPQWGMEQRILTKVRASDEPRRHWDNFWFPLIAAVSVAVLIAVLLTMREIRRMETPGQNTTVSHTKTPSMVVPLGVPPPVSGVNLEARNTGPKAILKARTRRTVEQLPRQAVFPAPTPMTSEEQSLVAFARRAPRNAEKVATAEEQRRQVPQKLTIQAINIEPLEAAGFGGRN